MSIAVLLQNPTKASCPDLSDFTHWANLSLARQFVAAELGIRLVAPAESAALNQQYRAKPNATNVLSFPYDLEPDEPMPYVGDLVMCPEVILAEAQQANIDLQAHWAHLTIHGILHLVGFDHQTDQQATRMETQEIHLLAQLGFNNPYEN